MHYFTMNVQYKIDFEMLFTLSVQSAKKQENRLLAKVKSVLFQAQKHIFL